MQEIEYRGFDIISTPNRLQDGRFSTNGSIRNIRGGVLEDQPFDGGIHNTEREADDAFINFARAWIDENFT